MTEPTAQPRRLEHFMLAAILLVYAGLAVLYATQTPDWQVPDEPAHYNYTRQVAEGGCCPVLEMGDWDADYLSQLTSSGFEPQFLDRLDTLQYEDHQPPLFYLLAAPLYSLTGGSLTALRLFSALLGAGVILSVYGITRAVSGGNSITALSATAFSAFVPQHIAILAGAGNDSLAELVVAAGVLLTSWYLTPATPRRFKPGPVALGVVMGLGFVTKASTFVLGPVIMLAILLRWWQQEGSGQIASRDWQRLLTAWARFLIPALVIGAIWWVRNIALYGWPDFLGLGRHDAVVVGQPRTADWIAEKGFGGWLSDGIRTTFNSFWGQFGWMGVPMPQWVYTLLLLFTLVSYAGLLPLAARYRRGTSQQIRHLLLIIAALFVLGILAFVYYNTAFVQFQGRYLYPAMAAFALAYAGGWSGWAGLLANRSGWRWLPVGVMWGLAGLSVLALWRFLIPALPVW